MKEFQAQVEAQLLTMGYINCEQLQQAKQLQSKISCSLGKALWSLNQVTLPEFLQVVALATDRKLLTQWLINSETVLDFSLAKAFEPAYLRQIGFFPCAWQDSTTLVVAVEEPGNPAVTQALLSAWPQANYYEVLATKNQIMMLVGKNSSYNG